MIRKTVIGRISSLILKGDMNMNEITMNHKTFIGYEYKDVTVKRSMESIYADGYIHFGWELEGTTSTIRGVDNLTMKFKRDRKIRNKVELTRLQRQFESCVTDITLLERSKSITASTVAYIVGVAGTGFMAGSVFAYLANSLALSIILAIPGFIGWIIPYFCYTNLYKKKSNAVSPLIDQKYDEIYDVCEKANGLLER